MAPGDDPAPPVELPAGPVLGRAVVVAHAEGEAVAITAFAPIDDVDRLSNRSTCAIVATSPGRSGRPAPVPVVR